MMRKDAGVDGDAQRIGQLAWMLFLKIFDDQEKEREIRNGKYVSPMPAHLRWREWAGEDEGLTGDKLLDFINNDLFKTLKELSVPHAETGAQIIRQVFADSNNYMKNGTLIRQVINKINEMDFNRSEDRRQFGEIYEKILKDLQSAGNAGEFYTPRAVTQFMTEMLDPKAGEKVLDPACGTGGFLSCTIDHVRTRYVKTPEQETRLQVSVLGIEKKQLPHVLCITNMMLHGIETPSFILHDNALREGDKGITEKDRVDVILTNPPFGGQEEDGIETNFSIKSRETADLFLLLIIRLLKKGGRCGIVLPDGTLFGDGVKARIKEKLLEECRLHTIVRLPNGVFNPYTGIKTNLLFFTKRGPTEEIWFYEHPYPEGYKSYSKTKPMQMEEFEPEKAWWNARTENEYAWKIDFKTLKQEALSKAKPHWAEADAHTKEAMRLEAEVRMIAKDIAELKKEDEKKNRKKIKALQDKQKQFQKDAEQLREKAKMAQETGDAVYWPIYNLDLPNPHQAKTEKRDSEKMLKDYRELLQEITEIREQLKQELMNAIGGKSA
ncbi:MAG: N-6 DNA methylase [Desulfobacterales bacterium]